MVNHQLVPQCGGVVTPAYCARVVLLFQPAFIVRVGETELAAQMARAHLDLAVWIGLAPLRVPLISAELAAMSHAPFTLF